MSPDRSGKGLWGRIKEVLGVAGEDDEDLASAPQVIRTFTAHRFPSGKGPLSGPLFPTERDEAGKWELYEDGWKQTEVTASPEPRADPGRDAWAPADADTAPADVPPADVPPEGPPPAPPAQPPRPVPAAEQRRDDDHPQDPLRAASPASPADDGSDELSATLEAWAAEGDPAGLLAHVDDDEADALARAFGFDELLRRRPGAPGARPTREPDPDEVVRPPGPVTRDTGAERQVEVHEERVAQAQGRARRAPRPGVSVHDAHLDHPAGPVTLTPSEAMALAERGRDAIGPRTDVGPAG